MKRRISVFLLAVFTALTIIDSNCQAANPPSSMYARSAVLIDGSNKRVLYGLNENDAYPMASTTKIMTLAIALEYAWDDLVITISPYAATQPDVQLNARAGEQYLIKDMLYMMMLQSYNDVAMALAENIGQIMCGETPEGEVIAKRTYEESKKYVAVFVDAMNEKASELGCADTYFITPNGLDAEDETGKHHTTAYELAVMSAYALTVPGLIDITTTKSYSCSELNGKRAVSINTTDRFLDMCRGAVGLKTGFTNEAGFCFVGAVVQDERVFVSVVLGCGWPPNKNYKWADTRKMMNYATSTFFTKTIFTAKESYRTIRVIDGQEDGVDTEIPYNLSILLSDDEKVRVIYKLDEAVRAPVSMGQQLGSVYIYIDDVLYTTLPIYAKADIKKVNYFWYFRKIISFFLF